jgi:hypothetical protein
MNTAEAKEYVNQRFAELTEDNPEWTRQLKSNVIIKELGIDHGFRLTTPTGHGIVGISEDDHGIIYHVEG